MKHGKIENGMVTDVINGLHPDGYTLITVKWLLPTDYPIEFYAQGSNEPLYTVVDNGKGIDENLEFILRPINQIKDLIYTKQKQERYKRQLGVFTFNSQQIILHDQYDVWTIKTFQDVIVPTDFNVTGNQWIVLNPGDISLLKLDLHNHIQGAYDWAKIEYDLVEAMTTVDELKTYFNSM